LLVDWIEVVGAQAESLRYGALWLMWVGRLGAELRG